MSIASALPPRGRPRLSYELYPPRSPEQAERTWLALQQLAATLPRFISVTYPSAAEGRAAASEMIDRVIADSDLLPMAHLTVVGHDRAGLADRIRGLLRAGVRDVLALRGDPPSGGEWATHPGGLGSAAELIALVREVESEERASGRLHGPISVGCATNPAAPGQPLDREIAAMTAKQAAGASLAVTQVFYEPASYVELVEALRANGVTIPVVPGIIPLTNPDRLLRLEAMTGVAVPRALLARLKDPATRGPEGIRATADLVEAVVAAGAPAIHVFTFNQAGPTVALAAELARRGVIDGGPGAPLMAASGTPEHHPTARPKGTP